MAMLCTSITLYSMSSHTIHHVVSPCHNKGRGHTMGLTSSYVIYSTIKGAMILLSPWHNADEPAWLRLHTEYQSCPYLLAHKYLMLRHWIKQWISSGVSANSHAHDLTAVGIYTTQSGARKTSKTLQKTVIIHFPFTFFIWSKYISPNSSEHLRAQGRNWLTDNMHILPLTASLAFCLCCSFPTIPLTLRCPVTHFLLYKYSVQWSVPQSIFISALLIRSAQNVLIYSLRRQFSEELSNNEWHGAGRIWHKDLGAFAACPCQLLLPFLTINITANISHQWGNQIRTSEN